MAANNNSVLHGHQDIYLLDNDILHFYFSANQIKLKNLQKSCQWIFNYYKKFANCIEDFIGLDIEKKWKDKIYRVYLLDFSSLANKTSIPLLIMWALSIKGNFSQAQGRLDQTLGLPSTEIDFMSVIQFQRWSFGVGVVIVILRLIFGCQNLITEV